MNHQELSGEQLPDSESSLNMIAIATCKEEKEKEEFGEQNRVNDQANNSLQQEQEQGKPDQLVKGGQRKGKEGAYNPHPPAHRGKGIPGSRTFPTAGKELAEPSKKKSLNKELEQRGKSKEGRRKQQRKEEGEAYRPQPRAYQGKGEHQLPNSAHRACRDKLEPKGGNRERGSLQSPASMVQLLLEDRAHRPSLLAEHQRPAPKAPTEESLAQPAQKEAASKRQWRPIFC